MTELIDNELVGEAVDAYLDWRDECDAVSAASDLWCHAPAADARTAASAYLAALDREEHAANVYAHAITRIAAAPDDGGGTPSTSPPVTFWRAPWAR